MKNDTRPKQPYKIKQEEGEQIEERWNARTEKRCDSRKYVSRCVGRSVARQRGWCHINITETVGSWRPHSPGPTVCKGVWDEVSVEGARNVNRARGGPYFVL